MRLHTVMRLHLLLTVTLAHSSFAENATWNGTTDTLWSTVGNWSATPSPVPGTTETATFDNPGNGRTTIDLETGITLKSIVFNTANAASYTIGSGGPDSQQINFDQTGSSITIGADVIADQRINARCVLGTATAAAALTITNDSPTNALSFNGTIEGGAGGTAGNKSVAVKGVGRINFLNVVKGGAARVQFTYSGSGVMTLGGSSDNTNTTCAVNSTTGGVVLLDKSSSSSVLALNPSFSTIITNGTLRLGGTGGNQLPDALPVAANGGFFDLNDRAETISGLTSTTADARILNNGASASHLTLGHATAAYAFEGNIIDHNNSGTGTIALTKVLSNTQTLTGTNTYSGPTTISAGTLALSGSGSIANSTVISVANGAVFSVLSSGFSIGSGKILTGAGTVTGGAVTVEGNLTPGDSGQGTLTLDALTLASGSTLSFEFPDSGANDLIHITGSGGLAIHGGSISLFNAGSATPFSQPGTYNLFQYSGAIGGGGTGALSVANPQSGKTYAFESSGGFVKLTISGAESPPPETNNSFDAWPQNWTQNTAGYSTTSTGGLGGGPALNLNNTAPISYTGQFLSGGLNGSAGLSGINGSSGIVAVGTYFRIPGSLPQRIDNPGSDALIQLGLNLGPAGGSFTGLPQLDLRFAGPDAFELSDSAAGVASRAFLLEANAWYHLQFIATNAGYVAELHQSSHTGLIGSEIAALSVKSTTFTTTPANSDNYGGIRSFYASGTVVIDNFRVSNIGNARKAEKLLRRTPNILMIYVDDMGFNDLGCYAYPGNLATGGQPSPYPETAAYAAPNQAVASPGGNPVSLTPNIDRLASQGVKLTNYHAPASVCTPSRGGCLTGTTPARLGFSGAIQPATTYGLRTREITLAEALKGNGYTTASVGKWHLGNLVQHLPTRHGFDRFWGITRSNNQAPELYDQEIQVDTIGNNNQADLLERFTHKLINFVEEEQTRPFFAYFTPHAPHAPMIAHPDFVGSSTALLGNRAYLNGDGTTNTNSIAASPFHDVIHELDYRVGQILTKLDELGLAENTVVVFTSDNGPWHGWTAADNGTGGEIGTGFPYRGGKFDYWEGGTRVPAIIRFPNAIPAGVISNGLVSGTDWFKTFVNLGGGTIPTDRTLDGEDLWPFLTGAPGAASPRSLYYHVTNSPGTVQSATNGVFKKFGNVNQARLADLRTDFTETIDTQSANPAINTLYAQQITNHSASLAAETRGTEPVATQQIVLNTGTGRFVEVDEGGSGAFTVRLLNAPTSNLTVNLRRRSGSADLTVTPASLTFTTSNWATPQTATINAAADTDSITDHAAFEIEGLSSMPMREVFARSNDRTPGSFSSWIADPLWGFAPADRDPNANPDGDLHNNLMEYALSGHDPDQGGEANQPVPNTDGSFSFFLNSEADSLIRNFESSETLAPGSWLPVPLSWHSFSIGSSAEEVHTIHLPQDTQKKFLRLKVAEPAQ
jgi:arylsulfatase A